jgi:hypothetical protein
MSKTPESTRIGIGATDGYRYIGIEPPLGKEELAMFRAISDLESDRDISIERVDDQQPNATLIKVSGDFDGLHPELRTEKAKVLAKSVAHLLEFMRKTSVSTNLDVIDLQGHHSTPFHPNTDEQ